MTDLPVNHEAEIQLLGGLLMNNSAFDAVASFLTPEMFADDRHGKIFALCAEIIGSGEKATPTTIKSRVDWSAMGGLDATYLMRLAKAAVTIINADQLGRIIQDCWHRRQIIDAAARATIAAQDMDAAPAQIAAEAGLALDTALMEGRSSRRGKTLGDAFDVALQRTEKAWQSPAHVSGLSTGIERLDKRTGGLHDGELIVAAGRPGIGKSALAYQIARHNASAEKPVLLFNLEMPAEQLAMRDLAAETGVTTDRQRKGDLTEMDMMNLTTAAFNNRDLPLFIEDEPPYTMGQIRQIARWYARKHRIALIVLDYLQLVTSPPGTRLENRVQAVGDTSAGLKLLARTLNVPVLALSQLSRAVEQREDKRPMLSDLRESGSIEQDADSVWLIYREEYYLEREEPKKRDNEGEDAHQTRKARWQARLDACAGRGEVFIAKQRMGPIGTAELRWNGERTRFEDL